MIDPSHRNLAESIRAEVLALPPSRRGLNFLVRRFIRSIPEATTRDVASFLDCSTDYVRAVERRFKIRTKKVRTQRV